MLGIHQGRFDLASILIEHGADPNLCVAGSVSRGGFSISPIYTALVEDSEDALRPFLVERVDPNTECFREGMLHALESRRGSADAVLAQLLEHARGRMDGMEAQYLLAAAEGGARESCRVLLDMGVAIDTRGSFGLTPLMAAAGSGSVEVVELLLDGGADRTLKDKAGKTALDYLEQAETRGLPSDRIELLRGRLAIGDGRR
jgi:ankyrin repeat protein